MSQWVKRLGVVAMGVLLAAGAGRSTAAPDGERVDMLAVLVGQTFLRSVVDKDLKTAAPLLAQKVDFDGRRVSGEKRVRAQLARIMARMTVRRRLRKVVVLPLDQAKRLFGPPPARLKLPPRKDLIVAFGRFQRGGLIAVLAPQGDRWRVIALTD